MVEAVGATYFAADSRQVMQLLLSEQFRSLRSDDPQMPYLTQCLVRICSALKQDFVPFLQHIIPNLLASAAVEAFVVPPSRP